ncbi:MAG: phage major capsid protein [Candidatus Hydrogenedentota bacterium]|nr:MAG: phage major capsid protein [Candidatus Hydrogenedentota bacterium]
MTDVKTKPDSELLSLVHAIKEKVDSGAQRELINAMIQDALKQQRRSVRETRSRKGEYSLDGESGRLARPELTPELQARADEIYLASKLLRRDPRGLKMWGQFAREASALRKAMDTATSEEGLEWIPTGFSTELIRKVKLALKVAALHARVAMPTNPFKLPIDGADAVAYLTAESTSDTATKITASTPGTSNVTFDAVKLACRVLVSTELEEDSIVAILPLLRDKIVQALAEAQENATINGDTAGTHQDSDVTSASDVRKAWDGYRKLALSAAKVDCATFDITNLRAIRAAMGKYGVNPNNLAWIAGITVFNKMLGLDEVVTADKYGPNATILTGELAKLDGIPVIVSEFIREDLNASGVYDGTTTDNTVLPLVYRPAFLYGDRRNITLRVSHELYMETDQDVAIATQRLDFQPVQDATSEPIVGLGYNIAS